MSKFEDIQDSLTMKEWAIIERKAEVSITAVADPKENKAGLMTAMAWVVKKREQANFTYEEAENLTMKQVEAILGLDEVEEDPKDT